MSANPAPALPLPTRRGRRWLFRLILVGLLLGFGELLARGAFWVIDGKPYQAERIRGDQLARRKEPGLQVRTSAEQRKPDLELLHHHTVVHPYQGYVYEPNGDAKRGEKFGVSAFGFVDEQNPIQRRAPDKVIVGILGGSVAMGLSVEGAATIAEGFAQIPRFAGRSVQFVRLGLGGYKQPQQLLTLTYLLSLGAQFDVVINLDGFNEVAIYPTENAFKHVHPAFPRSWYMLAYELKDETMRRLIGEATLLQDRRKRWAETFLPVKLALTDLVWRVGDSRFSDQLAATIERFQQHQPSDEAFQATGPKTTFESSESMMAELVRIWKEASLQLHALCQGNGIEYYHFLQPNQYYPETKTLTEHERRSAFRDQHPYRQGAKLGYSLLVSAGKEVTGHGVAFADLSRLYESVTEDIYIDDCCHVNAVGNELMAKAIVKAIARSP